MNRRNTSGKQLVREVLEQAGAALSADRIIQELEGRIDRVTVYRNLEAFCADGLVHRIVSDEGKAYFALCKGCKPEHHRHDHAHFRCQSCERVECIPGAVRPRLPEGYVPASLNYWISGFCAACGVA